VGKDLSNPRKYVRKVKARIIYMPDDPEKKVKGFF